MKLRYFNLKHIKTIQILVLFTVFSSGTLLSQPFEIKGIVKDSLEGEALPGAAVIVMDNSNGAVTDNRGMFQLHTGDSILQIQVSYLGYANASMHLHLRKDTLIQIFLHPLSIESEEVVITTDSKQTDNTNIGNVKLLQKNIELMPSVGGERDLLKILMLTPGIQSVSEGSSGMYVRGGNAGQNLILLDDMPLYNPNHLLGFFPVFNAPVIKNIEITKGIDDAETGGRLSSVVRVSMKDGNSDELKGELNMGVLSSSVTLSGRVNDKTSILMSGRRTYLQLIQDLVLKKISNDKFIDNTRYTFQDYYFKINHEVSKKDRLRFLFYGGFDDYNFHNKSIDFKNRMNWNNIAASAAWTHSFNNGAYSQVMAGYTSYYHQMKSTFDTYAFQMGSDIQDYYFKNKITYDQWNKHLIKTGFEYIRHRNIPGQVSAEALSIDFKKKDIYYSNELAVFLSDNINFGSNLSLDAGLRFNRYEHVGPFELVEFNDIDQPEDTLQYQKGEHIYVHHSLEPRLIVNWKINELQSIKTGLAKLTQPMHLVPVGGVSLPADIWFSSSRFAPPAESWQYSVGYYRNLSFLNLETSAEIYYKQMTNLVERTKSILNNFDEAGIQQSFTTGTGTAAGVELYVSKPSGKFTGWLSYTLSKSIRKFESLNDGEVFPSKYDRPHDLSVVGNYNINDTWSVSGIFVYATGTAMTLPIGRYVMQGIIMNDYSDVNAFRLPDYHRLDLSINYRNKKKWGEYIWNFSIYNVYNRSNPYYMFFETEADIDSYFLKVEPQSVSLYPMLPSVALILKF